MTIRRATETDCDAILTCLRSAFEPYRNAYTPAAYEDTVLTRHTLLERIRTMSVFVAVTDQGEIIGTIACHVRSEREGHLRGMAVDPQWHGRGVSQQLLLRAESELRNQGRDRITLDTTQYLERAIHFYERNGYRRTGKVADFFGMPLYEFIKT